MTSDGRSHELAHYMNATLAAHSVAVACAIVISPRSFHIPRIHCEKCCLNVQIFMLKLLYHNMQTLRKAYDDDCKL